MGIHVICLHFLAVDVVTALQPILIRCLSALYLGSAGEEHQ